MDQFEQVDILLVEDNPYDAELTLRSLRQKNLANHVEWLQDGAEAVDFIFCRNAHEGRKGQPLPKLILLDIKLPKLNGIEVLKTIKGDAVTKLIPVVMLTSSAEDRDLIACYEYGVNSYIVKPVNFEKFGEEVSKAGFYWMLMNRLPPR